MITAAPKPAFAFIQHSLLESTADIIYSVWYNDGINSDGTTDGYNLLTQYAVATASIQGLGSSTGGFETDMVASTALPLLPFGQSPIINGVPVDFNESGNGQVLFSGGGTFGLGDFVPFTGTLSTLDPDFNDLFPCCYAPVPYYAYGFNLPPGGHPSSQLPDFSGPPADGLVLEPLHSIVFGIVHPAGRGVGIGGAGFYFNEENVLTGGGADLDSIPGRAQPPVIPEPASLILVGIGLSGAAWRRRILTRKRV